MLGRFFRDRRGNVAIIFALSLIPCVFLAGMALDFTVATQRRVLLNAAADAARACRGHAVDDAAVDHQCANRGDQRFQRRRFDSHRRDEHYADNHRRRQRRLIRTATVSYTANSTNNFPNVLKLLTRTGRANWPIAGSASSTASTSPNIDFYLLLDNSPSMNIAATTAGITTMVSNTSSQGGCAFACHEIESGSRQSRQSRRRRQLHAGAKSRRGDADSEYGRRGLGADDDGGHD